LLPVDGFEKTGTKKAVHFDGSPDYAVRKLVQFLARLFPPQILGVLGALAVHSLSSIPTLVELLNPFHYLRTRP
jgi:hypothetical protein